MVQVLVSIHELCKIGGRTLQLTGFTADHHVEEAPRWYRGWSHGQLLSVAVPRVIVVVLSCALGSAARRGAPYCAGYTPRAPDRGLNNVSAWVLCAVCCVSLWTTAQGWYIIWVKHAQTRSMADNMNSTAAGRGEKWWSVVKAIAYELKPFSLPTIQGVSNAGRSVRTNAGQIVAEIKRVAPEAVGVVKAFDPLKALGLFAWICGWALFIWLEFGE